MGDFFIYENWQAGPHKAGVHRGKCGHCNHGTGKAGGYNPSHASWHGPYADLAAARRASAAMANVIEGAECRCVAHKSAATAN
jgi:hypothetical protein